ncbi:hypothetical protein [Burkholderia ubonensis]|uniref:hypothetical protein n=1 Tax=Burkholderia ubonensis TaxID=101571 RepID=UPI000ADAD77F|nr:hypothetical protein [Burkholderia ubonensis]
MGFRTVVLLENDRASEWENDPELGKKIVHAAMFASARIEPGDKASFVGGRVLECTYADTQTLAVLDSYNMNSLAHSNWQRGQTAEDVAIQLLRQAADKLGYTLAKKPSR